LNCLEWGNEDERKRKRGRERERKGKKREGVRCIKLEKVKEEGEEKENLVNKKR
jgi:hypothetical protein